MRCCWRPGRRLLLFTEATDQTGIRAIVFIAQQFTLPKSFDLCRIDNADRVSLLVQIKRYRFAINTSGLQAGMNRTCRFLFGEPNRKLSKSCFTVSKAPMPQFVVN